MSGLADTTLQLRSGARIPQVGLGVWQTPSGTTTRQAVAAALDVGYRHIDTARIYGNEADVGAAVRASGVAREAVFVTTKLWNADQGYDRALRAFDESLERLGLDYVDLYPIHWPVAGKRRDSWRALERIHAEGARAFDSASATSWCRISRSCWARRRGSRPSTRSSSRRSCSGARRARCARSTASSSRRTARSRTGKRLDHPVVKDVARRVGRSPAQVLLRWGVQHGLVVLPKSTKPARIAENGALFDFTLDDRAMKALDALEEGLVTGWDPAEQP